MPSTGMAYSADPDDDAQRPDAVLRLISLVIGSAEVIAFLLRAHLLLQSTDPLASDVGTGLPVLMGLPILLFTLPGLILAWLNRSPRIALLLVLLGIPAAALCWT